MRKPAPESDSVRITLQYRSKTGFSYDLRGGGERVTVSISPAYSPAGAAEGWSVEGVTAVAEGKQRVVGHGGTRAEALRSMGERWAIEHLPSFDWDAVAVALTAVRAL